MAQKEEELERILEQVKERFHYRLYLDSLREDIGTAGSGNWGHLGRKGMRGGSAPGGGVQNRRTIPDTETYTSWSKQRSAVAKLHRPTGDELRQLPAGSRVVSGSGKVYIKHKRDTFYLEGTNHIAKISEIAAEQARIAVPDSSNPNLQKEMADFGGYRERMEKAPRYKGQSAVDGILRDGSGQVWQGLDDAHKDALAYYTGTGYRTLNKAMRNGTAKGVTKGRINRIAEAIDQSSMPQDMWLVRGSGRETAAKLFGISYFDLMAVVNGKVPASTLVGLKGTDHGFMSTGSTEGTGFSRDVSLHIFAPKGTKGLYVEPFSSCGYGAKKYWDGKSKQGDFSHEFETLLQKDTSLQISRAWVEGGQLHVECFVAEQGSAEVKGTKKSKK